MVVCAVPLLVSGTVPPKSEPLTRNCTEPSEGARLGDVTVAVKVSDCGETTVAVPGASVVVVDAGDTVSVAGVSALCKVAA